jgi:hypothetical protein
MSTLSIHRPRVSTESDVDVRFDALVRSAVPAPQSDRADVDFATVFDLDYGQPAIVPETPVRQPQAGRRVRAVAVEPRRPVPRAVRLTRRGRAVVILVFVAFALAAMTAMGGWATATLSGGTPEPVRVIEVGPGDTLYGIAGDLAKPGDVRAMVNRIQELNSLPGGQISEGQKLAVPRG